jgi:hypothetical protein
MATVTPNYSWPVPTSTDLVKDGASAIEALGDAIDATVFGLPSSGMTLISTTTIGTTVSSVNVTSAFSTTYDNYKIIVSGGVSSSTPTFSLKLGSTATGYYSAGRYVAWAGTLDVIVNNNATSWAATAGQGSADGLFANIELNSPFLSKRTRMEATYFDSQGIARVAGYLGDTTSYTDFTLTPSNGTLTGGTIRVYGYQN